MMGYWDEAEGNLVKEPKTFDQFLYDNDSNGGAITKIEEINFLIGEYEVVAGEALDNLKTLRNIYVDFDKVCPSIQTIENKINTQIGSFKTGEQALFKNMKAAVEQAMKKDDSLKEDLEILNQLENGSSIADIAEGSGSSTYTVQQGDTLTKIANENNTTVEEIAAANNIVDPNVIVTGQALVIPGAVAATTGSTIQTGNYEEMTYTAYDSSTDNRHYSESRLNGDYNSPSIPVTTPGTSNLDKDTSVNDSTTPAAPSTNPYSPGTTPYYEWQKANVADYTSNAPLVTPGVQNNESTAETYQQITEVYQSPLVKDYQANTNQLPKDFATLVPEAPTTPVPSYAGKSFLNMTIPETIQYCKDKKAEAYTTYQGKEWYQMSYYELQAYQKSVPYSERSFWSWSTKDGLTAATDYLTKPYTERSPLTWTPVETFNYLLKY